MRSADIEILAKASVDVRALPQMVQSGCIWFAVLPVSCNWWNGPAGVEGISFQFEEFLVVPSQTQLQSSNMRVNYAECPEGLVEILHDGLELVSKACC